MAKKNESNFAHIIYSLPLWQLKIKEVVGRNLETRGRVTVNRLLKSGWILLHIYTLRYEENGVWRERPMAILGKPSEDIKDIISPKNPRKDAK